MLRPVLENGLNVITSMLNESEINMLEMCQRKVLKIFSGFEMSYANSLEKAGLET